MGWKGALRTIQAEIKRAERRQTQYEKMRLSDQGRSMVYKQDAYLEKVKSFQNIFVEKIDWKVILNAEEPIAPARTRVCEFEATAKLEAYKPSWFIRNLRLVQWRIGILNRNIEESKIKDEEIYRALRIKYESDYKNWKEAKSRATQIFANDLSAYEEVLISKSVFKDGEIMCSSIGITFNGGLLNVEADLLSQEELLPNKIYSVTKTGKISEKSFPKTHYNQLYQDYVCSVSLGVAKVFFGLFPDEKILVHCMGNVLNTTNGNMERQTLLSVLIPRKNLDTLNLIQIDPSDCMRNFTHNMNFKNIDGLKPTTQLKANGGRAS